MTPVETTFTDRSYRYTQLKRQGDIAIYQQQHKAHAAVIRYEVVRIRPRPATTLPSGVLLPEREAYPSSSAWGTDGWTFYKLADAEAFAATLRPTQST